MIVLHIESGLGNQMLSYCEGISLKKANPEADLYVDTITYDIKEANSVYCQWGGYELGRIFGINTPNIKTLFTQKQWNEIINYIEKSKFWEKNWNWPVYFTEAFLLEGLPLKNLLGDFEEKNRLKQKSLNYKIHNNPLYKRLQETNIFWPVKHLLKSIYYKPKSDKAYLFYHASEDIFAGQRLIFKFRDNNIESIENEIFDIFKFPPLTEKKNIEFWQDTKNLNTVAVHLRRGDFLKDNELYYKGGYFKRAIRFIKKKISNPVFCFFSDSDGFEWIRCNADVLGLDLENDKTIFVDWNTGVNSFRDMQLMSMCKHNIITNSTFGWWGAFLNRNPEKITISPEIEINTTHHL